MTVPPPRRGYLVAMVRAAAFNFLGSTLAVVLMQQQSAADVPGEMVGILLWTLPFALASGAVAPVVVRLVFSRLPRLANYLLAIPLGVVGAYLWERAVYSVFINPFFGVFSVPLFFPWVAGGVAGMVGVAGLGSLEARGTFGLEVLLAGAMALSIGLWSDEFVNWVFQQRQIEIVWVRWHKGPEPVRLDSYLPRDLTAEEIARLRRLGLTGCLQWYGTSRPGQGPVSRMVIVAQRMIEGEVELGLPAEGSVIYIQQEDGTWQMEPPDAALLDRTIPLVPDPTFPNLISALIKVPGGTVIASGVSFEDRSDGTSEGVDHACPP